MNSSDSDWSYGLRASFYALTPSETYHQSIVDVPDIISKFLSVFFIMLVLELLWLFVVGQKEAIRMYNTIVNITTGSIPLVFKSAFFRGAEVSAYIWVFTNCRITTLAWDSFSSYLVALLGVDFCYYWWHRASHEVAIMWTAHYVHHSSEDFNLSVAARNSFTVQMVKWLYFTPLAALGLPPAVFLIHSQMGFVYAAASHSAAFPKLGKIIPVFGDLVELVLVTPSHHRVHHGTNKYALDKNFGQVFIIFDRMFGTFAEEREDEELTYGTIGQHKSFHVVGIQLLPWAELWEKVRSMDTFGNKLRALFYGPGWTPGKPRLGDLDDLPDVRNRSKHSMNVSSWFSLYMVVHFTLVFYSFVDITIRLKTVEGWVPQINLTYVILGYTSLGGLYDAHLYTQWLEPARLLVFIGLCQMLPMLGSATATTWVSTINFLSLLLCPALASLTRTRAKEASMPKVEQNGVAVGKEKEH